MKNKSQEFEIALGLLEQGHDANNITQELASDEELLEMLEVVKLAQLLPRQEPSPTRQLFMLNQVKSRLPDYESRPGRSFPWLALPELFKKNPARAMFSVSHPGTNPRLRKLGEVVMAFTLVLVVILGLLATTRDLPQNIPATPVRGVPAATVPVFTTLPANSAEALTAIPVTATATKSATIPASPAPTSALISPATTQAQASATIQAGTTTALQPTSKIKPGQSPTPSRSVVTAPAAPTPTAPAPTAAAPTQAPPATSTPVPATTQVPLPTPKPTATATPQPTPRLELTPTPKEKEEGDPPKQGEGD